MCLIAARLIALDRVSNFAAGQDEGTRKRLAAGGRMVMAVVVLGNVVGLAANAAAAVHSQFAKGCQCRQHSICGVPRTTPIMGRCAMSKNLMCVSIHNGVGC